MASRPQRTAATKAAAASAASPSLSLPPAPPPSKSRMSEWDQVAPGELAFDFTLPGAEPKSTSLDWGHKDRASVKEAIIRWLEEQL